MFNKVGFILYLLKDVAIVFSILVIFIIYCRNWSILKYRFLKNEYQNIAITILLLAFLIFTIPDTIKYCMDIPAFITEDYKVEVGEISDTYEEEEDRYTKYQVVVVNGIELKGNIAYRDITSYYYYKFYYLPNTHWIISYIGYK